MLRRRNALWLIGCALLLATSACVGHHRIGTYGPAYYPRADIRYQPGYYTTHDNRYYHYDRSIDGWHYGRRHGEHHGRWKRHRHHRWH